MMESYELLGKLSTKQKFNKNKEIIADNLQKIVKYLNQDDIMTLKLTCQPFYYYFITSQLWQTLKQNIAQKKLQYIQDFDFQQKQPIQITKKDKNIRIHSLKKHVQSNQPQIKKRQSSNLNHKAKQTNQNNDFFSCTTEIGFKRLLKMGNKKKTSQLYQQLRDLRQLPKINQLSEYLININDPFSKNIRKTQKLIQVFKKINQFHHKFHLQLKTQSKSMQQLCRKIKKAEQNCQKYLQTTTKQPYSIIIKSIQGSQQNLLTDERLNKICKLFWKYHTQISHLKSQLKLGKQLFQQQKLKILSSQRIKARPAIKYIQYINNIDEQIELQYNFCLNNNELCKIIAGQIIGINSNIIQQLENQNVCFQDHLVFCNLKTISWNVLALHPFFSQTMFQILISITQKLLKISSTFCPDDLIISITVNRIKSIKSVCQSLLNISKYFGKIRKQVELKKKQNRNDKNINIIQQFLLSFQINNKQQLYLVKNFNKLQQIIHFFKQQIAILKLQIDNH